MADNQVENLLAALDDGNGDIEPIDKNEVLILEVQKAPWLWDPASPDYRDVLKKNNTWASIGQKIALNGNECQKAWKSLRDKFTRELRLKEPKSGEPGGHSIGSQWMYLKTMDFIRRIVKRRKTSENLVALEPQSEYSPSEGDNPLGHLETEEESISIPIQATPAAQAAPYDSTNAISSGGNCGFSGSTFGLPPSQLLSGIKRKSLNSHIVTALKQASESIGHMQQCVMKNKVQDETQRDPDTLYCLSLVPQLAPMSPRKKAKVKMQIASLLYNIEYGEQYS